MKNYVAPKSSVLSMNMNENIAASTSPLAFFEINNNTGMLINSNVAADAYTNGELFAFIFSGDEAYKPLGDCLL